MRNFFDPKKYCLLLAGSIVAVAGHGYITVVIICDVSIINNLILHVEAAKGKGQAGGRAYSLRCNIPVFISQLHCEHVISHDRGGITKTLITFLLNILEKK